MKSEMTICSESLVHALASFTGHINEGNNAVAMRPQVQQAFAINY